MVSWAQARCSSWRTSDNRLGRLLADTLMLEATTPSDNVELTKVCLLVRSINTTDNIVRICLFQTLKTF
jgi:hypothetical protein